MDSRLAPPRYVLLARLPRRAETQIEDAVLGLVGTTRPTMGFHISLVGPFVWTVPDPQPLIEGLARRLQDLVLPPIEIGGMGSFEGDETYALYLSVERSQALLRLHRVAYAVLEPAIELQYALSPEGYVPHVTLGLDFTEVERARALASLSERPLHLTVEIERLDLMEQQGRSPWRSIRAFPLAATAGARAHGEDEH